MQLRLLINLSSLASVLQKLFMISPSYPCVTVVLPVSLLMLISTDSHLLPVNNERCCCGRHRHHRDDVPSGVVRVDTNIIRDDVMLGVGCEQAGDMPLGHHVLITVAAFGSKLVQSAVARVAINIIGVAVQLSECCKLAGDRVLVHPHHIQIVLVRT